MTSKLSAQEMADLAAYADGTLPADRRGPVEARIAASPELQELLDRQRKAVAATREAASEPVPASLRDAVRDRVRGGDTSRRRPRLVPGLALGGAIAAAAAVVLTLVLAGGPSGPTVADAARLASQPPTGSAPARLDDSKAKLKARVDDVVFPDFSRMYGWHPVGVRQEQVEGRDAKVVYYERKGDRIGYVITSGSALPQPSGAKTVKRWGVPFDKLTVDGKATVTWERLGHTCVLTGAASPSELVKLASWRGGGTLSY
jgi:anti-sigma factor RsiW